MSDRELATSDQKFWSQPKFKKKSEKPSFRIRQRFSGIFGYHLMTNSDHRVVLTTNERDAMAIYEATGMLTFALPMGERLDQNVGGFFYLSFLYRENFLQVFYSVFIYASIFLIDWLRLQLLSNRAILYNRKRSKTQCYSCFFETYLKYFEFYETYLHERIILHGLSSSAQS